MLIIYPHVARTAGTTISHLFKSIFSKHIQQSEWCFNKLQGLNCNEILNVEFIFGHMPYGAHKFFGLHRTFKYFTILRNPVSRYISEYHYWLEKTDSPFYGVIKENNLTLHKWTELRCGVENAHCQVISGQVAPKLKTWSTLCNMRNVSIADAAKYIINEQSIKELPEELFELAKYNLGKSNFIAGITEQFNETLIVLKSELNLDIGALPYQVMNDSNAPKLSEISGDTIKLIEELNSADIELYSFAQDKFSRQIDALGDTFYKDYYQLNKLLTY